MQERDGQVIRLGPFGGLDGARTAEHTMGIAQPMPMRGGFNVELKGGELWVRRGIDFVGGSKINYASIPWYWVVEWLSDKFAYLVSPWHALKIKLTDGTVTQATTPDVTENITFNGTNSATSTSTLQKNDLIIVGSGSTYSSEVYRALAISGTTVTLDRPAQSSGTSSCRVVRCFAGSSIDIPDDNSVYNANPRSNGGVCAIDQLISHSANDLYSGSPAITVGTYLVITDTELVLDGPVAFPMNAEGAWIGGVRTNWVRNTAKSPPTSPSKKGDCCTVINNRLILGTCNDPMGNYSERTIWFSWPGDILLWHTGLSGANAAPNYVTFNQGSEYNMIRAVNADGPNLIVHRTYSQEIGSPQGSASAPFSFRSNEQGLGLVHPQAICTANRTQYLMSQQGPAVFTSEGGVQPIALQLRPVIESMLAWDDCGLVSHDPLMGRIYFCSTLGTRHHRASVPATDTSVAVGGTGNTWTNTTSVLVYDYQQQAWWVEDHIAMIGCGLGVSLGLLCRPDGTVTNLDGQGNIGKDQDDTSGTHVVDAKVELPWINLASPGRRAMIRKVVIGLRALDSNDSAVGLKDDLLDLWTSTSDTIHFCTVKLFTDHNATTAQDEEDVSMVVSEMKSLGGDENNQLPLIEFVLTGLRHSATTAKLLFENALSSAASSAGHKKGHFRLAYVNLFVTGGESDRFENATGE